MPPPRQSLKAFLASARAALAARHAPLTIVVGNDSQDLDSLCSAIVCAYLRSHAAPHALHVPLAALPRADLPLRTEMTAALAHAGLVPDDLPTLSDLPDPSSSSPSATTLLRDARWFLVDHNALSGALRPWQPRHVVGVIDHHVDERAFAGPQVDPRIVQPCGSCASLVVSAHRAIWDALPPAPDDDDALARLALAPILVDTSNLTDAAKTTDQDRAALDFLHGKLHPRGGTSPSALFDALAAVKQDIDGLSFRDVLRKDYKEWRDPHGLALGISCAVRNLDDLLAREAEPGDFLAAVAAWAAERALDLASVMTVSGAGDGFQRHLLVWGVTHKGLGAAERFVRVGAPLRLETWRGGLLDGEGRRAWRQMNVAASRKQVAPLLRAALEDKHEEESS